MRSVLTGITTMLHRLACEQNLEVNVNKHKWENILRKGLLNFTLKYGAIGGLFGCFLGMSFRYAYMSITQKQFIDYSVFLSNDWGWIPFLIGWGWLLTYFSWFELKKKFENDQT